MNGIDYTLIRSDRKTLALQIKNGKLIVRAPKRLSEKKIKAIVEERRAWIEKHLCAVPALPPFDAEELEELCARAKSHVPCRVAHFAALMGLSYGRITIRKQRTRWGSCSSKGNLNFNCLLMLAPQEVLDSVIIHELCHLKQMNHGKAFYAELFKYCPDYHQRRLWLKTQGKALMARL